MVGSRTKAQEMRAGNRIKNLSWNWWHKQERDRSQGTTGLVKAMRPCSRDSYQWAKLVAKWVRKPPIQRRFSILTWTILYSILLWGSTRRKLKNYWMKYAEVVKGVMMFEDYAQRPRRGRRRLSCRRQHDRPHTARLVGCTCCMYPIWFTRDAVKYSLELFLLPLCRVLGKWKRSNMPPPGPLILYMYVPYKAYLVYFDKSKS